MSPAAQNTASINGISKQYAQTILKTFVAATGAKNMGLQETADLTGFNWSTVPVCLVEMGFMTNAAEDKKLTEDAYQALCAQGIYNGIVESFQGTSAAVKTVTAEQMKPYSILNHNFVKLEAYSVDGSAFVLSSTLETF